jgi:hypothetical protein
MAVRETEIMTMHVANLAASANDVLQFHFPWPARIVRYFAVPSVGEAAHSTQALDCTFVNEGTDGTGTATLAVLTNDSDLADTTTRESGAWVANVVKELKTEARPATPTNAQNSHDEIAAGSTIACTVAKAAGTTTGDVTVGIEFQRGS